MMCEIPASTKWRRSVRVFMARLRKLAMIAGNRFLLGALIRCGVAASTEHISLLRRLEYSVVVDIGANRGQFALAALAACPSATIFSFEPLPKPAGIFDRLFAALENVSLIQAAITQGNVGEVLMHVSAADDSSSLLEISAIQTSLFPGTEEIGTLSVQAGPLSNYLSANDIGRRALLKIDVQGYEIGVIRGCADLAGCFTWLLVECSFVELYRGQSLASDVINELGQMGFVLIGVYNVAYDDAQLAIQGDFLFRNARFQ